MISVSKQSTYVSFSIYPNPAKDLVQLVLPLEFVDQKSKTISIFDTSGRLLYSKDISHRLDQIISLDISSFEKGNYFVSFISPAIKDSLFWSKN